MMTTHDTNIELSRYFDVSGQLQIVTVADYKSYVANKDQNSIALFIFHRLHSRYLKPFQFADKNFIEQFKNGFSIMANCCLLIETLQSFKNGWEDSSNKSALAFKQFLSTETNFAVFRNKEKEFYINIRCGILHQGETTGGWKINREGINLFNSTNHVVDSIVFSKELEKSLEDYSGKLKTEKWDSETWDNFRTKMRRIVLNCER
jgi:hypothetical protein